MNYFKNFMESSRETKMLIGTLVIMGIVIIASLFWGYALLGTRRSHPKTTVEQQLPQN